LSIALIENWQAHGFGLYLHWPFCDAKCPYCDFNSHVVRSIDHDAWLAAYVEELEKAADETPQRVLTSIFFGGGTPSLMQPRVIEAILDRIAALWPLANDVEISLEANPGSAQGGFFRDVAKAGINRVSLGVQALSDTDLARLGRIHTVAEARKAVEDALNAFERVSFDLIYGRQDQTAQDWEDELKQALTWGTRHLSLYQLTIEEGTAFGDRYARNKLKGLPDDDLSVDLFQITNDVCTAAGLPRYEVSNHAAAGEACRHNLIYWNYGDYLGIGPGAHGRLSFGDGRFATVHARAPNQWLKGQREVERHSLSPEDSADEALLMGLRLRSGFDITRYQQMAGRALSHLDDVVQEGWIERTGDIIRTTDEGIVLLNSILERLLDPR
jgi:oxygen-independent coproporphyrinogen-3 oxidase